MFTSTENGRFGDKAGAERQGDTWSRRRAPSQPVQNEKDRRRGHVAVVGQDGLRVSQIFIIEIQTVANRGQDARSAGMNRPGLHIVELEIIASQPAFEPGAE